MKNIVSNILGAILGMIMFKSLLKRIGVINKNSIFNLDFNILT